MPLSWIGDIVLGVWLPGNACTSAEIAEGIE